MGGNVERHIGDDDRDGAAIEALQPGGNGMTHAARDVLAERQRQIERLTKERDEARAQVAFNPTTVLAGATETPRAWLDVMGERVRQITVEGWLWIKG